MQLNLKRVKPHMSKNDKKIRKHRLHNNYPYERVSTQNECGYYFISRFEFSLVLKPNGLHSCES